MKRVGGAVVGAVAVVALSGCGGLVGEPAEEFTPETTILEDAVESCEAADDVLGDGGASLTFDTMGEDESIGDDMEVVACVMSYVDMPDYVIDHVDSTRAMDGQQTDEWDDIEARWTYHPDSGLQITLIDRS